MYRIIIHSWINIENLVPSRPPIARAVAAAPPGVPGSILSAPPPVATQR